MGESEEEGHPGLFRVLLPHYWGPGGLFFLLLAAPALAQMPDASDTTPGGPPAPITAPAPLPPVLPPASLAAPPGTNTHINSISGPINRPHIEKLHTVYGGEVTFDADRADADLRAKRYTLSGHVRLHETDTTLRAGTVTFDGVAGSGGAENALIGQKVFTLRSARLHGTLLHGTLGQIEAEDGDFATVPLDEKADYHIHAQRITLTARTRQSAAGSRTVYQGVLRNATLYLFGVRLLTIPRITFQAGGGGGAARRQNTIPTFGVSARYGTYIAFGGTLHGGSVPAQYHVLLPTRQSVEATLTSQQTLYSPPSPPAPAAPPPAGPPTLLDRIRALATVPPGPLPDGDPLRFHDFLPEPNPIRLFDTPSRGGLGLAEELAVHVAARGRLRDDLYVSRLPEVTLRGQLPLTRLPAPPAYGDAESFRAALRHLVFYAEAQETVGDYREQPTNIRARRVRTQFGFSAYPLLIGSNTVLQPRLSVSTSSYSRGKSAYHYDQIDIAVNHYFSDLTALGVQFLASQTGGDSPFNFDVLDTSREVDLRLQLGNRHLITAGRLRYDLSRSGVIDYQIAVAPALRGFIPVFSYNFRTRTIGVGLEIKGVTF